MITTIFILSCVVVYLLVKTTPSLCFAKHPNPQVLKIDIASLLRMHMEGRTDIKAYKDYHLAWSDKVNELVDDSNIPWEIKMPSDDGLWGCPTVKYGDNKILIDLSGITTIEFRGCDNDGDEFIFTAFGYKRAVE